MGIEVEGQGAPELTERDLFPDPPQFTDEFLENCKSRGDFRPVFLEWYKFVGNLAITTAYLKHDSPAFGPVSRRNYHVLAGSINRIARLMVANVALAHEEGAFGEATEIIHRCIFETAIKVIWMTADATDARVERFLASGIQSDVELRTHIANTVADRGDGPLPIEQRMLDSIERTISSAELSRPAESIARLPDLASMIESLGWPRFMYIVAQRMGSHHVHGTWTNLTTHYLQRDGDAFVPRSSPNATRTQHLGFTCLLVLDALKAYAAHVVVEGEPREVLVALFDDTRDEIQEQFRSLVGGDPTI